MSRAGLQSGIAGDGGVMMSPSDVDVAVLIPCYNEENTVGTVVAEFRKHLPSATIYVFDNNSTDGTFAAAKASGAVVRSESRQGKGNVVRRMFADIDADIYVLVDGDATYDAPSAPNLVHLMIEDRLDLVNGARVSSTAEVYRPGHKIGNYIFTTLVGVLFGRQLTDILSGYKVLSRRFVKSFPALSGGFEIETELTIHALELRMPVGELRTEYKERPAGSESKLRTFHDGFRILFLIFRLLKDERPVQFFGAIGLLSIVVGLSFGVEVLLEFIQIGLVPRLPTALLSVAFVIVGLLSLFAGLILDSVTRTRQEVRRLSYLMIPSIRVRGSGDRTSLGSAVVEGGNRSEAM